MASGARLLRSFATKRRCTPELGDGLPTPRHARRLCRLRVPPPAPKRRAAPDVGGAVAAGAAVRTRRVPARDASLQTASAGALVCALRALASLPVSTAQPTTRIL